MASDVQCDQSEMGSTDALSVSGAAALANTMKIEQSDRNSLLCEDLPAIAATVTVLYFILSLSHLFFVAPPHNITLAAVAFSATTVLFAIFIAGRNSLIPPSASHPALFCAALMVLCVSTLHFYLLEQTFQATNFPIVLLGWGLIALSVRWFVAFSCLVGACWIVVVQFHPHDPNLIAHYSFMLISCAALSSLTFIIRYRSANRSIILRKTKAAANRTQQNSADREQEMKQAERRLEAKDTFLAHFSHELRTPLNAIVGFSETIQLETMGPIGNKKYAEYIEDIRDAGLHLTSMLEDLHDLVLIEKGEFSVTLTTCHVDQLLDQTISLLTHRAEKKDIQLSVECDAELLYLTTDEKRLRQILVNLLTNAIKYTPADGKVRLIGKLETDGRILFEVLDTGVGMSDADLTNATTPFWRAAPGISAGDSEGSGLGLAITQKLVERLGATLELSSTKGVGTSAKTWLPQSCRALDCPSDNPFRTHQF
jgi:signal transduction histidine kinase